MNKKFLLPLLVIIAIGSVAIYLGFQSIQELQHQTPARIIRPREGVTEMALEKLSDSKDVEVILYSGKRAKFQTEIFRFRYRNSEFKIEIAPTGEDKYGHLSYVGSLSFLDPTSSEYHYVATFPTRRSGGGMKVYNHNDDVVVITESQERSGACCDTITTNLLIYDPILHQKDLRMISYKVTSGAEQVQPLDLSKGFSLFLVDNTLYLEETNARGFSFSALGKLYANSSKSTLGVSKYYLVKDGGIHELAEELRRGAHLTTAKLFDDILRERKWGREWLSPLLQRTLNLIFAGQREEAVRMFEGDFMKLNRAYPLNEVAPLVEPPPFPQEVTPAECSDGIDNDYDGATDLADDDCKAFRSVSPKSQSSATIDATPPITIEKIKEELKAISI